MTRATQDGWASSSTIELLAAATILVLAFVVIELRSRAPLLPLRMFRLRTLTAANAAGLVIAAVTFSMFFLLTLYMQEVLHYSPVQTGVAFIATTLSVIVFSNVAQTLVTRFGARRILAAGLLLAAASLALLARLPVHGHYFWDLLPALVLAGMGVALSFVPMTIAGLTGVDRTDAGVASGLINTSRQVGGAIGLAAVSTIATTYTARYADKHVGVTPASSSALTHGFDVAFYVLAALAVLGAVVAAVFIEPQQAVEPEVVAPEPAATLREAA
jgi:MFS family permease